MAALGKLGGEQKWAVIFMCPQNLLGTAWVTTKKHNLFSTFHPLDMFPFPAASSFLASPCSLSLFPGDYDDDPELSAAFLADQDGLSILADLCAPFLTSPLHSSNGSPAIAEGDLLDMSLFLDEDVVELSAPEPAVKSVPDVVVIDDSSDDDDGALLSASLSNRMAIDRLGPGFCVRMPSGRDEVFCSVLAALQAYMLHNLPTGARPDLAALFTRDGTLGRVAGHALRRQFRLTLRNAGLPEYPQMDPKFSLFIAEFVITARATDDKTFRADCCQAARLGLTLYTPCGALMVKLGRTLLRL